MYPKLPGTYCFYNTINNKVYIGSAQCLYTRINNHLKNRDSNKYLQNSIIKHKLKAFNITFVITKTHAEALMQEQLMLDYLFQNNIPKYNISSTTGGGKVLNNYSNHQKISELGGGFKAKARYALEINKPKIIHTFKSSVEAAKFTSVPRSIIHDSCKNAKPKNGRGRWLFSDVSIDDLKVKFNNLTQKEIIGNKQLDYV